MSYIHKSVRETSDYKSIKELSLNFYANGVIINLSQEEINSDGEHITTVNTYLSNSEAIQMRDELLSAYPL